MHLQPIILQSLVGFTADEAVLLNMPFGFLQWIAILIASWLAQRYQNKSAILFAWNIPVIVGVALLYALPKTKAMQGPLLLGYCAYRSESAYQRRFAWLTSAMPTPTDLMSFLFSFNPLILAWMGSNVAGEPALFSSPLGYRTALRLPFLHIDHSARPNQEVDV